MGGIGSCSSRAQSGWVRGAYLGGVGLALHVLAHGVDDAHALATLGVGALAHLHGGGGTGGRGQEGVHGGEGQDAHEEQGAADLEHLGVCV